MNDRGSGREQWDVEEQGRAVVQFLGTGTGTGTRRRVTDSGNLGAAGVLESLKKTRGLRTQFVHRVDKTRQDQTRPDKTTRRERAEIWWPSSGLLSGTAGGPWVGRTVSPRRVDVNCTG